MRRGGNRPQVQGAPGAKAERRSIDNLDAHDGYQPSKGHAGAALLPALAALAPDGLSGRAALAALVVGYEVSYRAAVALHATTADYHTSGAWNALGCVAIAARLIDRVSLQGAVVVGLFSGRRWGCDDVGSPKADRADGYSDSRAINRA